MAFTAALDNTYATDAQLYQLYQATRSLELHSGSMVGVTNGLMAYTASNTSLNSGLRGEVDGIEAYTASLKGQAIVSSSTQIQNYDLFALNSNVYNGTGSIKAEVAGIESYTASLKAAAIVSSSTQIQNYDVFALNSNLYTSTGSLIGITNGLMAFTAALDSTYATDAQLYQLYQATRSIELTTGSLIGITNGLMAFTAALDNTYATDAQLYQLYQATQSLELLSGSLIGITNGLMAFTAALDSTYATDAQLYQLYAETASIKAEIGGIELYTASLKAASIVSSSTQVQNYDLFALNSNLYNGTGSIKGEIAGIEAYTASLKGAIEVSGQDVNVLGMITAQQFNVTLVSSSVMYQSGSTKFGDTSDDKHEFTGSAFILGDIDIISPTGTNNVIIGKGAAINEPTALDSVIIGYEAGANSDSINNQNSNVSIGYRAGYNANGGSCTFVGYQAGFGGNTTGGGGFGTGNTGIGSNALININGGDFNTAIGNGAGNGLTTGGNNIFIGYGTNTSFGTYAADNYQIAIGHQITARGTGTTVIGTPGQTTHTYLEGLITGSSLEIGGNITGSNLQLGGGELNVVNNAGSDINITTNNQAGSSGTPLQTNINFLGYNGNQNGRIRVDDISSTVQVGAMEFYTWNSAEVLTLRLAHTGDATLPAGNLVIGTAGKGIDFSATSNGSGTTSSEILNDYEEGTWSPQIYYQNATDQTNSTNVTQVGTYTKIGNVVVVSGVLQWTVTGSPANDNIGIKNLPFTSKAGSDYRWYGNVVMVNAGAYPTYGYILEVAQNSTLMLFEDTSVGAGNYGDDIGATGTKTARFTITYLSA